MSTREASPQTRPDQTRAGAAAWWSGAYAALYLAAGSADLLSTRWALAAAQAHEANPFATTAGAYDDLKAWATTLAGGVLLTGLFAFGVRRADRVSERWLQHPMGSFVGQGANLLLFNPWSRRAADRAALHAICYAAAFPLLRLLAAGNNLVIVAGGAGPIGVAVREVGRRTTPAVGLLSVGGALYLGLALMIAPPAARFLRRLRA